MKILNDFKTAQHLIGIEVVRRGNRSATPNKKYVSNQQDVRDAFLSACGHGEVKNLRSFKKVIARLHRLAYCGKSGKSLYFRRFGELLLPSADFRPGIIRYHSDSHRNFTTYLKEVGRVASVAKILKDPYIVRSDIVYRLALPGISKDAGSFSLGSEHFYPKGGFIGEYIHHAHKHLVRALTSTTDNAFLSNLSFMYQYLVHAEPFDQINNSIWMNMVNGLLRARGLSPVSHSILDHCALRLLPRSFKHVFFDHVKKTSLFDEYLDGDVYIPTLSNPRQNARISRLPKWAK